MYNVNDSSTWGHHYKLLREAAKEAINNEQPYDYYLALAKELLIICDYDPDMFDAWQFMIAYTDARDNN